MRHAKAEQVGPSDLERELAAQGLADSLVAGTWLSEQGIVPQHALVSAAVRTRQTWDGVARGAGWDVVPTFDEGLYAAGPESALDLIRAVPDDVSTLIVIGHNPTMALLAALLDDGDGVAEAAQEMTQGFPTSAMAVFEHTGSWSDLDQQLARLVAFHVGRA